MLKLVDITKEYKIEDESTLALHGVSIEFRKSEFVSILGPSGCGKTTLLNIVGGLDRYTSGDIQVDGISTKEYDDVDWDTYRNRRIGFVFQSYNLIPHMNVLKNVAMGLTLAGVESDERKRRAMEALKKVGLENQARKKPNQLSGGQMQRVAIARALVNNPDIILADEPTGALDSEAGIQVMDLLKEVAEDRLVIMVTHNPMLAEEYSTRIVYLKDGEVEGDTKPYNSDEEAAAAKAQIDETAESVSQSNDLDASAQVEQSEQVEEGITRATKKKCKKQSRFATYMRKVRQKDKSSMNVGTAISLSFNNLLSKKGRTFLTSIAGSIGIIGIVLVLALSNGVNRYIDTMEQDALSQYPIEINETGFNVSSIMEMLEPVNNNREEHPDTDTVYVQGLLGNLGKLLTGGGMNALFGVNNLEQLKTYIDANFDPDWGQVKYEYGTDFNIYSNNIYNENGELTNNYIKVHPFVDFLGDTLGDLSLPKDIADMIAQYATSLDAWDELSSNQSLLDQQYELLDGSWPNEEDEIIVVLDSKNQLDDFTLFMLGMITGDDLGEAMNPEFSNRTYSVSDLLNLKYQIICNADMYQQNAQGQYNQLNIDNANFVYTDAEGTTHSAGIESREAYIKDLGERVINVRVSGVVRPRSGVIATSINSSVAYTHDLMIKMLELAESSPVTQAVIAEYDDLSKTFVSPVRINDLGIKYSDSLTGEEKVGIEAGQEISKDADDFKDIYSSILVKLGYADENKPTKIKIYSTTFETKNQIESFLAQYERDMNDSVTYSDFLSIIMGYVETMSNVMVGVLIGFSAISLIVSTIMIAIIIYTSVLERRKEIGVLRSLGARKKDISRVFIAESSMIGLYSGVIGIICSLILSVIGSVILFSVFKISNLMFVSWWHCVLMLAISIILSMLAGFVPSRMAANKDPAIALRSE